MLRAEITIFYSLTISLLSKKQKQKQGSSLVAQWLGLNIFTAVGPG